MKAFRTLGFVLFALPAAAQVPAELLTPRAPACAINANDRRIYCGPGDCAVDGNNGGVFCSRHQGGGALKNRNTGVVVCGHGLCQEREDSGLVLCARLNGGGAAINRNNGYVLCGAGECAVNENAGSVLCSPEPGGRAFVGAFGGVYCTAKGTLSHLNCVEGRDELCERAHPAHCLFGR